VVLLVDHHSSAADAKTRYDQTVVDDSQQIKARYSRLQDVTDVLDQELSIGRKLGQVYRRHSDGVLERLVDLVVVGHSSISHGLDDTVELELSGDISLLLLGAVGSGDTERRGVVAATTRNEECRVSKQSREQSGQAVLTKSRSWSGVRET
jgi:hypothetical protein